MYLPFKLSEPVSPNRVGYNRLNDTLKLKRGLQTLGFYEPTDEIYTPAATDDVFSALRDFQRASKLKVDAVANPGGPTETAMNAALAKTPPKSVLARPVPPPDPGVSYTNGQKVWGMGDMAGAGDFPALMAATLYSTDGHKAAPEVADLLKQSREVNAKQGADMRAQLSELLTPKDMARIDDAAGVPKEERTAPESAAGADVLMGQSGEDRPPEPKRESGNEVPFEMTPPIPNPTIRNDRLGYDSYGESRDAGARHHAGVDLEASPGAPVVSPVDGTVERIGDAYGDGEYRTIWIKTKDGSRVGMFYVEPTDADGNPTIKPGDTVNSGQMIGTMQDISKRYSSEAKGPMTNHLHLEIRRGERRGKPVDPAPWLRQWGLRD